MLKRTAQSGFSLIELAIVLVIAGLLISALLPLVGAQRTNAGISATRTREEAVKSALISFMARNSRLPCPAVETLAPGVAGYGVEAANPGTCADTAVIGVGPNPTVRGVIPWISLGLSDADGFDGYDHRFTYQVTLAATSLNAQNITTMRGSMTMHSAVPVAGGLNPTGNQINSCSTTAGDNSCNLAAVAVVISHGSNGFGAFRQDGGQMEAPPGAKSYGRRMRRIRSAL